jgi:hypothetical protein
VLPKISRPGTWVLIATTEGLTAAIADTKSGFIGRTCPSVVGGGLKPVLIGDGVSVVDTGVGLGSNVTYIQPVEASNNAKITILKANSFIFMLIPFREVGNFIFDYSTIKSI